jgi:hypothetical protein
MKKTETVFGVMGAERVVEPVAARTRPQLKNEHAQALQELHIATTHFASSPYKAVFTNAEVDILDATWWASSYVKAP